MADIQQDRGSFPRGKFKDLGDGSYAEIVALEPLSIGGGGGGPVDVLDRVARLLGHVNVDNFPVTQPISAVSLPLPTGAATEATLSAQSAKLPAALVGGRLDVNIGASGITLPVSGTFWQATQPISAVSLPLPSGASQEHITAVSFHAVRLTDGAAFYAAPVAAQLPAALVSGRLSVDASAVAVPVTDNAGSLTVDAPVGTPVYVRLSDGAAALIGQKVMATSLPVTLASDQILLLRDNRDQTNQNVMVAWEEMAGTAAAESALTNATFRTENFVALGAATSYTVPTAKRLRITNVSCYVKATAAVNNLARLRIRAVASGSVTNASPPVFDEILAFAAPGTVAAGLLAQQQYTFPEGSLDFAAGSQLAFTWFTSANSCTVGLTLVGYLYTP